MQHVLTGLTGWKFIVASVVLFAAVTVAVHTLFDRTDRSHHDR
jgi:hypothetical protein